MHFPPGPTSHAGSSRCSALRAREAGTVAGRAASRATAKLRANRVRCLAEHLGTFCPYREKLALMLPRSILPGRWQALGQRLSPSSSVCLVLYSTEFPLLFPHKHAQSIMHRTSCCGSARRFLRPATHHKRTGIRAGRPGTTNPLAHQGLCLSAVLLRTISSISTHS